MGDHCGSGCGCEARRAAPPAQMAGTVSRRGVLAGSAAVLTTMALAACGSDDTEPSGSGTSPSEDSAQPSASESDSASESGSAEPSASPSGTRLAGTDDFPVGGGAVVTTDSGVVVVTQPADGEFKAFDGTCPHQSCPVTEVSANVIVCQCHGSTFDGESGDRIGGPAPTGLAEVSVTVEDDGIFLA